MPEPLQLRDQIVATKLFVPAAQHAMVSRARLTALLDAGLHRKLTLVSAPAGFGKTTLLAVWLKGLSGAAPPDRRSAIPEPAVAWVSLDDGDNQPLRLWRHVLAALDAAQPSLMQPLLERLNGPDAPPLEYLLTAVINTLVDAPAQIILVLDDYHLISDPAVHASLSLLLDHLPPNLHLYLTSRTDPPLPLSRLRGRGEIVEIRTDHLRCTEQEVSAFLDQVMRLELRDDVVHELTARTEGWLAGLQLLGLSLQGRDHPEALLAELRGSHRYILDYLTDEVLRQQPAEIQTFLLHTAILKRLSAPLCDAVLDQPGSQRILDYLEHANLFLTPLDVQRHWYRYHHLFAEALRYRVHDSEVLPMLHTRAAHWYAAHGQVDDAIDHALLGQAWPLAIDLIETTARRPTFRHGELPLMQRWLGRVPADRIRARPRLSLVQARMLVLDNQPQAAETWLGAAEAALANDLHPSPDAREHQRVRAEIAARRAFIAAVYEQDSTKTLDLCLYADQFVNASDSFERGLIAFARALAHLAQNQIVEAIDHLRDTRHELEASNNTSGVILTWSVVAANMQLHGRLDEAERMFEEAIALGMGPDGPRQTAVGMAYAYHAELLRERNQLDAAFHEAQIGIDLAQQSGYQLYFDGAYLVLARIQLARGEREAAAAALEHARPAPHRRQTFFLYPWLLEIEQARLALAQGDHAKAARLLDAHPDERVAPFVRDQRDLERVRVLLAQQRPTEARDLVGLLRVRAHEGQRGSDLIALWVLQALAHRQLHEDVQALAAIKQAVQLAAPDGFIRVFADQGAPLVPLLTQARAQMPDDQTYIDTLLAALHGQPLMQPTPRPIAGLVPFRPLSRLPQSLIEPLSARELEVLQLLARGASNQDIADALVLSINTVKRHVSTIIAKLGVANRTQATHEARALGLLSEQVES